MSLRQKALRLVPDPLWKCGGARGPLEAARLAELVSLIRFFPFLTALPFGKLFPHQINIWVILQYVLFSWVVGIDLDWARPGFFPPSQAVDYYLKALRSLGTRDIHPAVWDSVNWELSTTYFTMATLQQDYAPLSRKAQEQVVILVGL